MNMQFCIKPVSSFRCMGPLASRAASSSIPSSCTVLAYSVLSPEPTADASGQPNIQTFPGGRASEWSGKVRAYLSRERGTFTGGNDVPIRSVPIRSVPSRRVAFSTAGPGPALSNTLLGGRDRVSSRLLPSHLIHFRPIPPSKR